MLCRPIYCPTSELYRYDGIPLRRHVDRSISIDIGQLHWQILMKKHHFDIVSIKATLCWTDISADIKWYKYHPIPLRTRYRPVDVRNRLQHGIRGKYAIMISFRYRYPYVGSIYHLMWYRYRYHVIPLSKRRQPFDVGEICGQRYR